MKIRVVIKRNYVDAAFILIMKVKTFDVLKTNVKYVAIVSIS